MKMQQCALAWILVSLALVRPTLTAKSEVAGGGARGLRASLREPAADNGYPKIRREAKEEKGKKENDNGTESDGTTSSARAASFLSSLVQRIQQLGPNDRDGLGLIEALGLYGNIFDKGYYGDLPPTWTVDVYDDGESSLNEEAGLRKNKYAWSGDFHKECGIGFMIHSAGTYGYVNELPTYPTITFRDADAKTLLQGSFRDPLSALGGPVLGIRAGIVTSCEGDTVTAVVSSIGRTSIPSTIYKVTADFKSQEMSVDVLIDDVNPLIEGNSIRSMALYNGNPCHIVFAPLREDSLPSSTIVPKIWTVDICAGDVASTLTPTGLYLEGQGRDSLVGDVIWDFACEEGALFAGKISKCWFNLVTVEPDMSKLATFDLKPLLLYGTIGAISPPTSDPNDEYYAPLTQIDTDDLLDASALVLEPVGSNRVMACTLSGFSYQNAYPAQYIEFRPRNMKQALATIELGYGQACYICGTFFNQCKEVETPGLSVTTTYIWQMVTCGDYVFFATFDQVGPIAVAIWSLLAEEFPSVIQGLTLPEESMLRIEQGGGALLLSVLLETRISMYDQGFDIWYIPKDNVGTGSFQPLVVDGFRSLETTTDRMENGKEWCEDERAYDAKIPVTNAARQLVCHSQPDGSDPTLMVGTAVFDERASSTYAIRLTEPC